MSDIRAFKAIRPTESLADKVAALPYDVMTSAEAREMVAGNPYSFLHVDKAEIDLDPSIDLYAPEVYAKARENLDRMIAEKTFIQDEKPCFYIYMLTMDGRAQTGLVACASIDEYLNNEIKKHELTREDKEQDRIRHVDICDANTGPIFLAYRNQPTVNEIIEAHKKNHAPVYNFTADGGVQHTVWVIECEEEIAKIRELFKNIPAMYIADGHHRNASAVKVGLKRRAEDPSYDKNAEFNFYLSVIFDAEQLKIYDYNRVVKSLNGYTKESFLEAVAQKFDVVEFSGEGCYCPEKRHMFGMYIDGKWYALTAKSEIVDENDPVAALDVSILQNYLLNPLLDIQDPRTDKKIDFVGGIRGLGELKKRVDSGEMVVAFSMFPTSMDELMNIADAGKLMPPKSTWFEPKLLSGLFVHRLS